ncbi:hypothetical protein PINS_up023164 [Pythium insidiosum]|nr:hypothetical protein PINS_up023164 [Pythium insidiosum]
MKQQPNDSAPTPIATASEQKTGAELRRSSSIAGAKKKLRAVIRLGSMAEIQAQKEIERIRNEHSSALVERTEALERDAALRKARLAERIAKRREAVLTSAAERSEAEQRELVDSIDQEEQRENHAIDEDLEVEKRKLAAEIERTQEQVKYAVEEAAKRNAEQLETLLESCKSAHAEESKRLSEALEVERQRQEQALRERIAKRREMKRTVQPKTVTEPTPLVSDDLDDEREQRELKAQLEAKEAAAWEEMRRKQEEELNILTKQAEEMALKKQDEARRMQEATQAELERLRKEHEAEMASLTTTLEAEQKRQQQQLQQRIAQRRQHKKEAESVAANEKERLAQLEEQERAERLALEAQLKEELERKLEEERERQRREEAALSMRAEQAAIDAAAADAARKAMDAAREVELERLATEYEEKSRELRQSHMADLMAQKKKLEARVAAKKQKKLMELEAKKELERRRLEEKQQAEQATLQSEEQQTQAALDNAVALVASTNDLSTPRMSEPLADESTPPQSLVEADVAAAKLEPIQRLQAEQTVSPSTDVAGHDEETEAAEVEAAQQEKDIVALQELFDQRIIPRRLTLMSGIELIVSQRHQTETSTLLANLYQEKTRAIRDGLREVMRQKAMKKALLARETTLSTDAREAALKSLDEAFETLIRETEAKTIAELEARHTARLERLQQRQLAQIQTLVTLFSAVHAASVARLQQEDAEAEVARQQLAKLEHLRDETQDGEEEATERHPRASRRRRGRVSKDEDDVDDLIDELRARLRVDADERIRELGMERDTQLAQLQRETESQLQRVETFFSSLLQEEKQAMESAFHQRLQELPASAAQAQRDVLTREKDAQVSSLILMLTGRCNQQMRRVKQLAARKAQTVEDEFDRKAQVIHAKMLQRLVEEKELIRKKRAIQGAVSEGQAVTGGENELLSTAKAVETTAPAAVSEFQAPQASDASAPSKAVSDAETMVARDLQALLEMRLSKIEELLSTRQPQNVMYMPDPKPVDESAAEAKVHAFKQSIADAIDDACQWRTVLHDLSESSTSSSDVLDIVPSDSIPPTTRGRVDFANALIGLMTMGPRESETLSACIRRVVVASSLPTRSASGLAHGTCFDPSTQTLYVLSECVERLSSGQLAVLMLHALVQAQTSCPDVADPAFIRQLYRVLLRSYESLYTKAQDEQPTPTAALTPRTTAISQDLVDKPSTSQRPRPSMPLPGQPLDGGWKAHVSELETFLSALDHSSPSRDADSKTGATTPRSAVARQSKLVATAIGMARSSSRYLLSSNPASSSKEGATEMEALMLQERRQFLLEKRDTAEKLYTQVLRQHQEQKESLEYIQEMLTEEQELDEGELTSDEEKAAHAKRVDELQRDVEAIEAALDKTRRERDDLFAQCQALRDELAQLPPSRPSTGAVPAVAESK